MKIQICTIQLQRSVRLESAPAPHTSMSSQARETTFLHVGPTHCIGLPDAANIPLVTPLPRLDSSVKPHQLGHYPQSPST